VTDSIALGATLYLPATRPDLGPIALGSRLPELRSAVICLEDAVRADEVAKGLGNLADLIGRLAGQAAPTRPKLFIRPRDPGMLARLLLMPGIEHVDGFVIPKATAESLPHYLRHLAYDHHLLMPTLETREVFDPIEMRRLRDQLLGIQSRVLVIRIGGNDLLQTIGARRSAVRTIYDGPLGSTIVNLVTAFAPHGFSLSAPVFEHFTEQDLLREEVERDIEHGLLTKTAIHPAQIAIIQSGYAVAPSELGEARAIISGESPAVFALEGSMCEPATHLRWALTMIRRAEHFGLRPDSVSAVA
jgi:citrate lyase beta subunit